MPVVQASVLGVQSGAQGDPEGSGVQVAVSD